MILRLLPVLAGAVAMAALLGSAVFAAVPRGRAPAAAAAGGPPAGIQRVKLWEKTPGVVAGADTDADPTEPTMDIYLPPADKATGMAMLVLPGGGYTNLAIGKEGTAFANLLMSHNIAAFVVRYRHAPRYHAPLPLMDAQRALRIVRSKAVEYHIDPKRIGMIGFSAGGHLAAWTATGYNDGPVAESPDAIDKVNARPDFVVLAYPVMTMTDDKVTHARSREALTENKQELYAQLSPEQHVTKDSPPAFITQAADDQTVPIMNSVIYYEACIKAGVPVEMHLFQNGRHGFGLGNDPAVKAWPDMMFRWLEHNKWLTPAAQ